MWTSKYKNLASIQSASSVYGKEIRLGFDPARLYFKDLERIYGDAVILFHDHLGGNVIGGVWNPAVQDARNFKVQLGFSSKPVALDGDVQSQMVRANEAGIIAEMMRLGQGLVEKVEIAGGGASSA
jgi:U3 small nucleolar RNA-associated protein 22